MPGRLSGRVALVTGAASGIGAATALRLAADGASVVGADLDAGSIDWSVGLALHVDVSDKSSCAAMVDAANIAFGRIDIVVTAAGIAGPAGTPLAGVRAEDWDRVLAVNLTGTMFTVQESLRVMPDCGAVITVASGAATKALPGVGPYCVSKAGVWMFTKVLALELAARRIRANCIAPGYIDTPMTAAAANRPGYRERIVRATPAARLGTPEDIASVAAFLASDEAAFVNGELLNADGGLAADSR